MRFKQIWDYIKETPNNTNPAILKQMVEEYGQTVSNPLSNYTIDLDISDEVDLLGKKISDLQSGVTYNDGEFKGELKYVTGYTGFSGNPEEQEGYYIAFHVAYEGADSIKVNGSTLDEDGIIILRFKNGNNKNSKANIEIIKDSNSFKDTVMLNKLILDPKIIEKVKTTHLDDPIEVPPVNPPVYQE